jgi:uncharacterized alkaline shock family protein YloU
VTGPDDVREEAAQTAPEPDAEVVAAAAVSCDGVHSLTRGSDVVEIATYLPGRRVLGVRVGAGHAEVHIVTEYGANVVAVADRVRAAVLAAVTDGGATPAPQVDVYVDDVQGPLNPGLPSVGRQEGSGSAIPGDAP